MNNRLYISNIVNEKRGAIEEAIALSGRTDILIDDEPMPAPPIDPNRFELTSYAVLRPDMVGKYFSIYSYSIPRVNRSNTAFWDVYEQVLKTPRWRTYLALVND